MPIERTEVVIVGGGPVGLIASLALNKFGIANIVVERRGETGTHPRARSLKIRTMEYLRQLGLEGDFIKIALPKEWSTTWEIGSKLREKPILILGTENGHRDPDSGELIYVSHDLSPVTHAVSSQDRIDALLYDLASGDGTSENIRMMTEMRGYSESDEGVTVDCTRLSDQADYQVQAKWLLGCDGWDSAVRKHMGIPRVGDFAIQHFLNVQIRADLSPWAGPGREAVVHSLILSKNRATFASLDGKTRWQVQVPYRPDLKPASDWTDADYLDRIRDMIGLTDEEDIEVEIIGVAPWAVNAAMAERFRKGRAFLLGDAAHVTPPLAGYGLNLGIQDVFNLVWKLAAVRAGANEALLRTYAPERRWAAQQIISWAASNARVMTAAGRLPLEKRRDVIAGLNLSTNLGLDLGMHYPKGAFIPDESSRSDEPSTIREYVPSALPGHRAPHLWLSAGSSNVSTLDLFGAGWVLLTGDQGHAWLAAAASISHATPLGVRGHVIGSGGEFEDEGGSFKSLYSLKPDGAVLVRPDGYVAYHWAAMPTDTETALRTALDAVFSGGNLERIGA